VAVDAKAHGQNQSAPGRPNPAATGAETDSFNGSGHPGQAISLGKGLAREEKREGQLLSILTVRPDR